MGNRIDEETLLVTALIAACGFGYFYFQDAQPPLQTMETISEASEEVQIIKPKSLVAIKEAPERQWDVEVMEFDSELSEILKRKDKHGWSHLLVKEVETLMNEAIQLGNEMRIANPVLPSGDTIPKMLVNLTKDLRNTAERARVVLAVSSVSLSDHSSARLGNVNDNNRHKQDTVVKTEDPGSAPKQTTPTPEQGQGFILLPQSEQTPAEQKEASEEGEKRAASDVSKDPGAAALAPKKVPENAFQQGQASDSIQQADQDHNAQALNDGETQIIPKETKSQTVIAGTNAVVPDENEQSFSQREGQAGAQKRARESLEEAEEGVKASGFVQGEEVRHDNKDEPPNKKRKPTPQGTPLPSSSGSTVEEEGLDFQMVEEPGHHHPTKESIVREIERQLAQRGPPYGPATRKVVEGYIAQLDSMWPKASVSLQQKAQWRTRLDRKPRIIKRPNTDTSLP